MAGKALTMIDAERIKKAMADKGLTMDAVSKVLGYSGSWMSSVLTRGSIGANDIERLCLLIGVKPGDIEVKEEPEAAKPKMGGDLQKIDDAMFEIVRNQRHQSQLLNDANVTLQDILKELKALNETMKNFKVEVHSDQKKSYDFMKFNLVKGVAK